MAKATRRGGDDVASKEALNTIESPSAAVVAKSQQSAEIVDSLGRRLKVKKFGALQRLKIIEMIGNLASNDAYLSQVAMACSVVEIDGERVPFPTSKRELEALVQRLDDEGLGAAQEGMAKVLGIEIDSEGNVTSLAQRQAEAAKNSQPTPNL